MLKEKKKEKKCNFCGSLYTQYFKRLMRTNEEGTTVTDQDQLRAMAVEFFQRLYTCDGGGGTYHVRDAFPRLSEAEIRGIVGPLKLRKSRQRFLAWGL